MDLYSFVPVKAKRKSKQNTVLAKSIEEKQETLNTLEKILAPVGHYATGTAVLEHLGGELREEVREGFESTSSLVPSKEILESKLTYANKYVGATADPTSAKKFADTPVAEIEDLKKLANRLDMLILPTDLVDIGESLKDEDYNVKYGVKDAISSARHADLAPWVVTPVNNYSLNQHLKSTKEFNPYVPNNLVQVFTTLRLMIPTLRGMINQINSLRDRVDDVSDLQKNLQTTVQQHTTQLLHIAKELENVRVEAARQEAVAVAQRNEIQRLSEASLFGAYDPMLIFIPEGVKDINTYKGIAHIGPVWGPDIEDIVVELCAIPIKNSKAVCKKLKNTMDQLFG